MGGSYCVIDERDITNIELFVDGINEKMYQKELVSYWIRFRCWSIQGFVFSCLLDECISTCSTENTCVCASSSYARYTCVQYYIQLKTMFSSI